MTYPLLLHFTTHVPGGGGDDQINLWNLWWTKYSMADLRTNPYYSDYIHVPYKVGLSLHAYIFLNGLLSIPLQYVFNLATINNLFIVLSFLLTALGTFFLIDYFVKDWRVSIVGGLIFAFCPFKMAHLPGHVNYTMTQWMPLYLLFFFKAFNEKENAIKYCLLSGVLLSLNFLTEHYYYIFLVILSFSYVVFLTIYTNLKKTYIFRTAFYIVAASLPFTLPAAIFIIRDKLSGKHPLIPPSSGEYVYGIDLASFLSPSPNNPIMGAYSICNRLDRNVENLAYLGVIVICLALIGACFGKCRGRIKLFWGSMFILFTTFSLGSNLKFFGMHTDMPMPFGIIKHIPILENLRVPGRLNIISMLCLSFFAAYGLKVILRKNKHLWAIASALIVMEYLVVPIPMFDSRIPEIYNRISDDRSGGTVLEIPFYAVDGFGGLGVKNASVQHYQSVHRKRLLNGFVSRMPIIEKYSYINLPFLGNIIAMQTNANQGPDYLEQGKRLSGETIGALNIDYIILHKQPGIYEQIIFDRISSYISGTGLVRKIYEDDGMNVFKTAGETGERLVIDLGSESSIPYLFRGWANGQVENGISYAWSVARGSVILLDLKEDSSYKLKMRIKSHQDIRECKVHVFINEALVAELRVAPEWKTYEVTVPEKDVSDGIDVFEIRTVDGAGAIVELTDLELDGLLNEILGDAYVSTIKYRQISELIFDWEQDNRKFKDIPVSVAVDYIDIETFK
jgi:hypothetical protein